MLAYQTLSFFLSKPDKIPHNNAHRITEEAEQTSALQQWRQQPPYHSPFPLSLPKPILPSFHPQRFTFSTLILNHRQNLTVPRISVQKSQVVTERDEKEDEEDEDEDVALKAASEDIKAKISVPKREEIFAVFMVGSRQYIVFPGRWIHTQRLKDAKVNDKVTASAPCFDSTCFKSEFIVLNKVLLVETKSSTYIGQPVVTNAAVHAVVEEQFLDKKRIVFKYKKKKNCTRNIGHRQPITRIRITAITGCEDYPAETSPPQLQ
ncbi:Large ribosomal subunit protein bL21c-like protein [Drosera capensis]